MFNAKVFRVRIASTGTILEEERLARDIITKWSLHHGEQKGIVFMPLSKESDSFTPDIYIFVADSFIDERIVDAALAEDVPVIIFSRMSHDICNSIPSEIKALEEYREKMRVKCTWVEYDGEKKFEKSFIESIEAFERRVKVFA